MSASARAGATRFWPWIAALVVVALAAALSPVPFLSEDWTQWERMRAIPSLAGALDLSLEPLRPLQHAYFWGLAHAGLDPAGSELPALARSLAFALHALSCLLVFHLARELGAGPREAALAALAFALFPNVKSLAWPAAIGSPGRVAFELLALAALVRHARSPRLATGVVGLASFVVALGFHESAMLLPAILASWIVLGQGGTLRVGLTRAWARARDPWFALVVIVGVAHFAHLAFLRPQRHHGLKGLAALPANVVKASLALAPEWVRDAGVEGFRGNWGTAGVVLAALAMLLVVVVAGWASARTPFGRFVVAAIALDLALPVIGAGFVQRYAYFAAALAAIGCARWVTEVQRPSARVAFALLVALWAVDTGVDTIEYRSAGQAARELVEGARRARESVGPGVAIAIVDPPDMHGSEEDVPLFNWGLDFLLEAHGVAGPWLLWRTGPSRTTTNVELVDRARLSAPDAPPKIVYPRR